MALSVTLRVREPRRGCKRVGDCPEEYARAGQGSTVQTRCIRVDTGHEDSMGMVESRLHQWRRVHRDACEAQCHDSDLDQELQLHIWQLASSWLGQ